MIYFSTGQTERKKNCFGPIRRLFSFFTFAQTEKNLCNKLVKTSENKKKFELTGSWSTSFFDTDRFWSLGIFQSQPCPLPGLPSSLVIWSVPSISIEVPDGSDDVT